MTTFIESKVWAKNKNQDGEETGVTRLVGKGPSDENCGRGDSDRKKQRTKLRSSTKRKRGDLTSTGGNLSETSLLNRGQKRSGEERNATTGKKENSRRIKGHRELGKTE